MHLEPAPQFSNITLQASRRIFKTFRGMTNVIDGFSHTATIPAELFPQI